MYGLVMCIVFSIVTNTRINGLSLGNFAYLALRLTAHCSGTAHSLILHSYYHHYLLYSIRRSLHGLSVLNTRETVRERNINRKARVGRNDPEIPKRQYRCLISLDLRIKPGDWMAISFACSGG